MFTAILWNWKCYSGGDMKRTSEATCVWYFVESHFDNKACDHDVIYVLKKEQNIYSPSICIWSYTGAVKIHSSTHIQVAGHLRVHPLRVLWMPTHSRNEFTLGIHRLLHAYKFTHSVKSLSGCLRELTPTFTACCSTFRQNTCYDKSWGNTRMYITAHGI